VRQQVVSKTKARLHGSEWPPGFVRDVLPHWSRTGAGDPVDPPGEGMSLEEVTYPAAGATVRA